MKFTAPVNGKYYFESKDKCLSFLIDLYAGQEIDFRESNIGSCMLCGDMTQSPLGHNFEDIADRQDK